MKVQARHGFVIPLTLMLIAVAMVLVTGIYQRGAAFVPFISTVLQRDQAKLLALSGVHVAMCQLAMPVEKMEQKTEAPSGPKKQPRYEQEQVTFLSKLLPVLNYWQKFVLTKDHDGVNGEIQIAVSCEGGKIDLNAIYDFEKKRFRGENELRGDWKKIMQFVCGSIQKKMGISENVFEQVEQFMRNRSSRLNDATELLSLSAFRAFAGHEFYKPLPVGQTEDTLFLMDIFTVQGGKALLNPWLLSDSIRGLFNMKRGITDIKQRKVVVHEWLKNFKTTIEPSRDWNTVFRPIYGIEFQQLPKGTDVVFNASFDPQTFSVVSYGVVGRMVQRAYVIVDRITRAEQGKTWYDVAIKKFYWL